jgi:hypothetical protein
VDSRGLLPGSRGKSESYFHALTPACALNDKQALALNELLDDVALTWMKASADVKTVFE